MKKEIIIVSIIVIATIILNIITQQYTNSAVTTMNNKLEEIEQIAQNNLENKELSQSNLIINKTENLNREWNKLNKNLAFYIEHDELEKVDTSIVTLSEYINLQQYEEAIPEIKKCEFIIAHIKDKESVKIINLF